MKNKISEKCAEMWGVPRDTLMDIPRITISGDREIYIENHRGIREYTDAAIRVAAASGGVKINGKSLRIERIRREDILISGVFSNIEYEI